MTNLNTLIIEGNCVRSADVKINSTCKVANFQVAVNRYFKNRNGEYETEVSFFDCVTFGTMAEVSEKQIVKGRSIRIVGRLKQDRWTDSDGKNRSKIVVICEHIEFKPMQKTEDVKADSVEEEKLIDESSEYCF